MLRLDCYFAQTATIKATWAQNAALTKKAPKNNSPKNASLKNISEELWLGETIDLLARTQRGQQLLKKAAAYGWSVASADRHPDIMALCDTATKTIYLTNHFSASVNAVCLAHELTHAWQDIYGLNDKPQSLANSIVINRFAEAQATSEELITAVALAKLGYPQALESQRNTTADGFGDKAQMILSKPNIISQNTLRKLHLLWFARDELIDYYDNAELSFQRTHLMRRKQHTPADCSEFLQDMMRDPFGRSYLTDNWLKQHWPILAQGWLQPQTQAEVKQRHTQLRLDLAQQGFAQALMQALGPAAVGELSASDAQIIYQAQQDLPQRLSDYLHIIKLSGNQPEHRDFLLKELQEAESQLAAQPAAARYVRQLQQKAQQHLAMP